MTTFWLLNDTMYQQALLRAGKQIDDSLVNVAVLQASGGALWVTGDAIVDAAAANVAKLEVQGNVGLAAGLMIAATIRSLKASPAGALLGSGSPNTVVTATTGQFYVDTAATPNALYVKTTSTGNTGWNAVGGSGGGSTPVPTTFAGTNAAGVVTWDLSTITATTTSLRLTPPAGGAPATWTSSAVTNLASLTALATIMYDAAPTNTSASAPPLQIPNPGFTTLLLYPGQIATLYTVPTTGELRLIVLNADAAAHAYAIAQPAWFYDSVNGSDTNSGAVIGLPVKTCQGEYSRRVSSAAFNGVYIAPNTAWNFLNNTTAGDSPNFALVPTSAGAQISMTVTGNQNPSMTVSMGTVATYTAKTGTAPAKITFTVPGSLPTLNGLFVITHSAASLYGRTITTATNAIGVLDNGAAAVVTVPTVGDVASRLIPVTIQSFPVHDDRIKITYTQMALPAFSGALGAGDTFVHCVPTLPHISPISGARVSTSCVGSRTFIGCAFATTNNQNDCHGGYWNFIAPVFNKTVQFRGCEASVDSPTTFANGATTPNLDIIDGGFVRLLGVQMFNTTGGGDLVSVSGSGFLQFVTGLITPLVSGSCVAGSCLRLSSGGRATYDSSNYIASTFTWAPSSGSALYVGDPDGTGAQPQYLPFVEAGAGFVLGGSTAIVGGFAMTAQPTTCVDYATFFGGTFNSDGVSGGRLFDPASGCSFLPATR